MGKKSIKKNYVYNLVYQVLILILPLITTPYISRVLGAEGVGIYSYTSSIVAYFTLFGSLGISLYGQREIAYAGENLSARKKVFWEMIVLRGITMAIAIVVYGVTFMNGAQYQIYYQILVLELVAAALDISWFFQGMEEFKVTVTRNVIVRLVSVGLIFLLIKNPADLAKYVLIYSLANVLGNLTLWVYLPKLFKGIKVKNFNFIRHIIPVVLLFIPQIANQIYNIVDKTMIGALISDKAELGNYEQSQKILRVLITIETSLGVVMIPRIVNIFANGDKKTLNSYIDKSFNLVFLLGFPMMLGMICVAKEFIPIFLGGGYQKAILLTQVLAPSILLYGMSNVLGTQYLLPTKRQKQYTISIVAGLIINVILNFLLVYPFGAVGVSISTIIAQTIVVLVQFYAVRKEINIPKIIRLSYKYIASSLVMFLLCILIGIFIKGNFTALVIKIAVGGIAYFLLLWRLKEENIMAGLEMIKTKALKKPIGKHYK